MYNKKNVHLNRTVVLEKPTILVTWANINIKQHYTQHYTLTTPPLLSPSLLSSLFRKGKSQTTLEHKCVEPTFLRLKKLLAWVEKYVQQERSLLFPQEDEDSRLPGRPQLTTPPTLKFYFCYSLTSQLLISFSIVVTAILNFFIVVTS